MTNVTPSLSAIRAAKFVLASWRVCMRITIVEQDGQPVPAFGFSNDGNDLPLETEWVSFSLAALKREAKALPTDGLVLSIARAIESNGNRLSEEQAVLLVGDRFRHMHLFRDEVLA